MLDLLSSWWTQIASFLVGGLVGYSVRVVFSRQNAGPGGAAAHQGGNGVQQTGNVAGGSIAGRDVRKD
jgi:hypothetical protein